MHILMHATSASPECILKAGKVYDVPNRIARAMLKATLVGNVSADDKNKIHVTSGGPAAVEYNERIHGRKPVLRVPSRPDPEDRPEISDEEEFEALQEVK